MHVKVLFSDILGRDAEFIELIRWLWLEWDGLA